MKQRLSIPIACMGSKPFPEGWPPGAAAPPPAGCAFCAGLAWAQPEYALRGLVGISGMYYTARPDPLGLVYRRDLYGRRRGKRAVMALMDPEHAAVTAALPPMLLTSSGADFLKAYTLRYADALRAQGRPCELVYFPEGKNLVHAFPSLHPDLPESKAALKRILAWMDTLG